MRNSSGTNRDTFVTLDPLADEVVSPPRVSIARSVDRPKTGAARLPTVVLPAAAFFSAIALVAAPALIEGNALPWQMAILLGLFLYLFLPKSIPDHIAPLVLLFGAGAIVGVPTEIVFSGFQSGATWIILAGFIIGAGIKETGLGDRIARGVLRRTSGSYASVVYGIFLSATVLVFLLPTAAGRVMLLVPIAVAVARRMGYAEGDPGHNGILLAAVMGTTVPAYAVLPASLPNVVMLGTAQGLYGLTFTYTEYFLTTFPALALPTVIGAPYLIIRLFPASSGELPYESGEREYGAPSSRMAWILIAALLLWTTDFLHGFAPVWVALGAAVACMAPRLGTIRQTPFDKCVHFGPWLLIASVVSLAAMIDHSGLGQIVGRAFIDLLGVHAGADASNFAKIVGMSTIVGVLTTSMASPAIVTTLAESIASGAGWPLETVIFAQIPAWFFIVLPHQVPIIVIGLTTGGVPTRAVLRFLLNFAAFGLLGATPLYFLWLDALGHFG